MKKNAGLWINHRKAVIVFLAGQEEEIKIIESSVERQMQHDSASHSGGSSVPADDRLQREFTEHLNNYYKDVISHIRDAESILIFGPGESKGELKKHLEHEGLGGLIIGVETTDRMTDHQIAAKVRQCFHQQ